MLQMMYRKSSNKMFTFRIRFSEIRSSKPVFIKEINFSKVILAHIWLTEGQIRIFINLEKILSCPLRQDSRIGKKLGMRPRKCGNMRRTWEGKKRKKRLRQSRSQANYVPLFPWLPSMPRATLNTGRGNKGLTVTRALV